MRKDALTSTAEEEAMRMEQSVDLLPQNNKDILEVGAEIGSTIATTYKATRAITKAAGDETMAYDRDIYKAAYAKNKEVAEGFKGGSLSLGELEKAHVDALAEASGGGENYNSNPASYVAGKLASALEIIPGLKKLREKNIIAAEQERISERYRLTPDMAAEVGRMMEAHSERMGGLYEGSTPASDVNYPMAFGGLEAALAIRLGMLDGNALGAGGSTVAPYWDVSQPDSPSSIYGSGKRTSIVTVGTDGEPRMEYDGTAFSEVFSLIEQGESIGFPTPWQAFNRGAAGDSLVVEVDANGRSRKRMISSAEIYGKDIQEMTFDELSGWQKSSDHEKELGAFGLFQVTEVFLDEAIKKGVVNSGDLATPENQIKLGIYSLTEKRPGIKAYLYSDNPTAEMRKRAALEMSMEYESFADPNTGSSYYSTKDGKPKAAKIHYISTMNALEKVRLNLKAEGVTSEVGYNQAQSALDKAVFSTLEKNKDKDFVRRILRPDDSPILKGAGPNGEDESHRMAVMDMEVGGKTKYAVYPTIQRNVEISGSKVNSDLKNYGMGKEGMDEAIKRKEYILFDSRDEADWFSKEYKRLWRRK
jgi:hypothetical protein